MPATEITHSPTSSKTESTKQAPAPTQSTFKPVGSLTVKFDIDGHAEFSLTGRVSPGWFDRSLPRLYTALMTHKKRRAKDAD